MGKISHNNCEKDSAIYSTKNVLKWRLGILLLGLELGLAVREVGLGLD